LLNGRPSENSIVADEGGNVTVGDSISNGTVDEIGEESDSVLEVGIDNLHDTRGKLHDANFRGLFHLRARIQETVRGNTSIGVNCISLALKNYECCRARPSCSPHGKQGTQEFHGRKNDLLSKI